MSIVSIKRVSRSTKDFQCIECKETIKEGSNYFRLFGSITEGEKSQVMRICGPCFFGHENEQINLWIDERIYRMAMLLFGGGERPEYLSNKVK